jgi:hypothetical protein
LIYFNNNLNVKTSSGSGFSIDPCLVYQAQSEAGILRKAVLLRDPKYLLLYSGAQQKYSIDINPRTAGKYELEVSNMVQGKWNSVFYKQSKN